MTLGQHTGIQERNWHVANRPRNARRETPAMSLFNRLSLRAILVIDALASGAIALLLLIGAGALDSAFDLPAAFLRGTGLVLVPWVVSLLAIASRKTMNRNAVWVVAAVNTGWVAGSAILPIVDWIEPNALGVTFIIVQAVAVALFTWLQIVKVVEDETRSWGSVARV